MNRPIYLALALFVLLAALLAACSPAASPQLIAAAPKNTPIARYPAAPDIRYQSEIWLQVSDVERTARAVSQTAVQLGGYLASSSTWYSGSGQAMTLELAVPGSAFERLRAYILSSGQVLEEQLTGKPSDPGRPIELTQFSTIYLHLLPAPTAWAPPADPSGWNPARTFQRAFGVFLNIFGFLADILIWTLVVVGPFVLMALGAFWLVRRMRRRPAGQAHPEN